MKRVVLSGVKNGLNVLFTLPETSVSGGVTFIAHGNTLLHAVTLSPGIGEYTLSGAVVTVGLAPIVGDALYGYISTSLTQGLERVELLGPQDGSNTSYEISALPPNNSNLFVFLAGNILDETTGTPGIGAFRLLGTTLTFGLAPNPTDDVAVYREITTATSLELLPETTVSAMVVSIPLIAPPDFTPILLVVFTGILLTVVDGTPTANQYVVTPTATETLVTFGVIPGADNLDIYVTGFAATPTLAVQSYEIFQHIYALGPEVEYLFSVVSEMRLRELSVFTLDRLDPNRVGESERPSAYAYRGRDAQGSLLVEIYPVPSEAALIRYAGIRRDACVDNAHALRGIDALVVNAATAAALMMIVAKTGTAEPWQTLAAQYQAKADRVLERLLELDFIKSGVAQVQGMRGDTNFPWDGTYLAEHDIWGYYE